MYSPPANLDGLEFLDYLWRRRAFTAVACVSAILVAAAASALLPRRYTATATVLIEPPGGNDPRAATAVSPVYLESLKTYQLLASSDTLFLRALNELHLRDRDSGASLESLKRRMLSINKPNNTSILEISATLNNPRQAQALAQYVAEHTVQLNARLDEQSNQDILREPQRQFQDAEARLARAAAARDAFARSTSVDAISKQAEAAGDLQKTVESDLARAQADLAEDAARENATTAERDFALAATAGVRARAGELQAQSDRLRDTLAHDTALLENLAHTRDSLDEELDAARTSEEAAAAKLADVQASAALRGVQLKVLDPGVVPQRPSFPNTPLNLLIAFTAALAGSTGFLAVRFASARARRAAADPVYTLRL